MNKNDLYEPSVHGVGFIGEGEYKSRKNSKMYGVWSSMIGRCYSPVTQSKQPTYIGCTVAKEWHNFQNFAKWYVENHPKGDVRYHLDKDKLVEGNKVYSPQNCCFITQGENTRIASENKIPYLMVNKYTGELGICKSITDFSKRAGCTRNNVSKVLKGIAKSAVGWELVGVVVDIDTYKTINS